MRVKLGASNLSVTAAPCHLPFQGRQAAAAGEGRTGADRGVRPYKNVVIEKWKGER